ncbi:MAG TPA: hypothetical protein VH597_08150 [Verrucomicrobiae bacterium]|jgi:hypothetical protein|nr:hypothetical protein [Verrucomicrobiae bacterium]
MKKALLLLTVLGIAVSPLMVSQAEAAPVTQVAKHHKKHLKKHAAKHHLRKQHRKTAA